MNRTLKGILSCLLAFALVIPSFSGAMAEIARENPVSDAIADVRANSSEETVVSGASKAFGVSDIRRGRTFNAANVQAEEGIEPTDIVTIMVELPEAPAADVVENLRNAGSYRSELVASQKQAAAAISSKLGVEVKITHNYSVLFNGFAFEGEYRLVEEIEKIDGMHAFVSPEWESPTLYNSTSMVGAIDAWNLGYSGKGYTIAVLDTGCLVDHPAFSTMPDEGKVQFTQEDIAALIEEGNFHGATSEEGMDVNEVYYNAKIPFRWNYYYQHADASHPGTSDHGTHVAGIATGNNDEIQGVAPDAQLVVMQVFSPSGSASWANILPALEDCAILGVAAANMSLGSACGREMFYDPSYEETLERCVEAGVNLSISAGNDYDSSRSNRWGGNYGVVSTDSINSNGYALVNTPDFGVVGSPSTWPHGLSVAAVENSMSRGYYLEVDGVMYAYSENGSNPVKMEELGGETYEFVMVPGNGTPEDFEQVDVEGKIAVVIRGGITFVAKADNAAAAGAVACVIYNNTAGTLSMVAYTGNIPHVAITQADGLAIAEAESNQMYVSDEMGLMSVASGNMTTAFSSRGVTANMAMKPEITAPGGQIYSSTDPGISGVSYDAWNGTSMSAPHVAGGMAIVSEFVDNNFPNASAAEKQELVNAIIMSTATPVYGPSGEYAPVHQQGAGEMNLRKATTTTAYLTVEGTKGDRPKLNLGDDPEKSGEYTAVFTVHNFGETALNYIIQPTVLLNDISILSYLDGEPVIVYNGNTMKLENGGLTYMPGDVNFDGEINSLDAVLISRQALGISRVNNAQSADLNGDGEVTVEDALIAMRIALGLMDPQDLVVTEEGDVNFDAPATVNVPAGEDLEVTINFTLSDDVKSYLDNYYTAGAMIEGFFELIPSVGENSLTVPFIQYYGDWNYPATIDSGYYYEDVQWNSNNFPNTAGYQTGDGTIYGLGINPYVETEDLSYYLEDRNAISPNADQFLDTLNVVYAGLLRNSFVRYVVCDTEGNEVYEIYESDLCPKGYRTRSSGRSQLGLTYMNFPGNFDFTQFELEDVVVRIIADLDNDGHYTTNAYTPEANENPSWDIPIHVDTQAPTISNVYVSGNGVTFDATDDHYVAAIIVMNEDGEVISTQGVFETERGAATNVTVQLEVGQYVVVADYAGNEQWFEFVGAPLIPIDPPELGPQLIYSQGFNTTDNTAGWNVVDKDGDGYNWGFRSSGNIYEGDRCMSSTSYQRNADNWLLAPAIELPEGEPYLTFYARGNYSTAFSEHFAIYIAPVGTPSVDDYVQISEEIVTENAWRMYTVDLTEYAGQEVRIAIRHFNTDNQNYLTMDLWQIWN